MTLCDDLSSPHMKRLPVDRMVDQTHKGQAHFGGTGPDGKTCRECARWFCERRCEIDENRWVREAYRYANTDTDGNVHLQPHHCNKLKAHKLMRLVPHDALACSHFEQADSPPETRRRFKRLKAVTNG